MELDRYLDTSAKLEVLDLDWNLARQSGLTANEVFILTYFSDIESQTIMYLRDLLNTKAAADPEVIGFLSMWNYEEYFHGKALAQFLEVCGHKLESERIQKVRAASLISEKVQSFFSAVLSKVYPEQFLSLYMAWGAIQELTTLKGYEKIAATTTNPVLKIMVERISKQERRHFSWYFNSAKKRLENDDMAKSLTRHLMQNFWSPVGAGVKPDNDVKRLILTLFPAGSAESMAQEVDSKISSLPGLAGLTLMKEFVEEAGT